jgi:hypothetical protein
VLGQYPLAVGAVVFVVIDLAMLWRIFLRIRVIRGDLGHGAGSLFGVLFSALRLSFVASVSNLSFASCFQKCRLELLRYISAEVIVASR